MGMGGERSTCTREDHNAVALLDDDIIRRVLNQVVVSLLDDSIPTPNVWHVQERHCQDARVQSPDAVP